MKAKLILENGICFEGKAFGYLDEDVVGEVVFNTGMTGYEEILTDPSYYGQIVTMTYPLIGNYGINLEDTESKNPKVRGFIVKELCNNPSNFRCEMDLNSYLKQNKILAIEGIDTRHLTKLLRNSGTMKGIITLKKLDEKEIKEKLQEFNNKDAVKMVTTNKPYVIEGSGKHIAVLDFGVKANILRAFKKRNCKLTVLPAYTSYKEILKLNPDGVFLSNGPGDPSDLKEIIENIKNLIGKIPIIGICLGHQLVALSLEGKTSKLKFGHRGCNHPVKDLEENKIYITSQNHGYVVSEIPKDMIITHINVNDKSCEGMKHKYMPIYTVQYHPEAAPGPLDGDYIFDKFLEIVK